MRADHRRGVGGEPPAQGVQGDGGGRHRRARPPRRPGPAAVADGPRAGDVQAQGQPDDRDLEGVQAPLGEQPERTDRGDVGRQGLVPRTVGGRGGGHRGSRRGRRRRPGQRGRQAEGRRHEDHLDAGERQEGTGAGGGQAGHEAPPVLPADRPEREQGRGLRREQAAVARPPGVRGQPDAGRGRQHARHREHGERRQRERAEPGHCRGEQSGGLPDVDQEPGPGRPPRGWRRRRAPRRWSPPGRGRPPTPRGP